MCIYNNVVTISGNKKAKTWLVEINVTKVKTLKEIKQKANAQLKQQ